MLDANQFEQNKTRCTNNEHMASLCNTLDNHLAFLDRFSFLQFGRDTIIGKTFLLPSPSVVIDSATKTLFSSKLCCEYGNMSDANILLRKYRDDLFFYLYLRLVGVDADLLDGKDATEHEKNIRQWIKNSLSDLHISKVLSYIGKHPRLRETVKKYNLHRTFNTIGTTLNDYVHSNGWQYYNKPLHRYDDKQLEEITSAFRYQLSYITVSFLLLLALITPSSIMSTDYIDALEMNESPPEGSQYWVAAFVSDYLRKNNDLLGDDCISHLQQATEMEFT